MVDNTRYDEQVRDHIQQHDTRADQGYLIRFEIVFAAFRTQGLGPDTPDLFQWNCSSSVLPLRACVDASASMVVVTASK